MNTVVPLEPYVQPHYLLYYEDGAVCIGQPGTWSQVAYLVTLDGVSCYLTEKSVTTLLLHPGTLHTIDLPEPLPCFALARFGVPFAGGAHAWLYSLFGYTYHRKRYVTTVSPTSIETHTVPVGTSFLT